MRYPAENNGQALVQAGFLRNMLLSTYAYRQDLLEVQTPTEEVGDLMVEFLRLPSPTAQPSPPDEGLVYDRSDSAATSEVSLSPAPTWASATLLDGEEPTDLVLASSQYIVINQERFDRPEPASPAYDVALLDYNYDFHVDLVHANADGLLIIEQDTNGVMTAKDAVVDDGGPLCECALYGGLDCRPGYRG